MVDAWDEMDGCNGAAVVIESLVFRSRQYMTNLHSFGRENVFLNICEQRDMLVSLVVVFSLPIGMLDTIKGRLDLGVDMQLVFPIMEIE